MTVSDIYQRYNDGSVADADFYTMFIDNIYLIMKGVRSAYFDAFHATDPVKDNQTLQDCKRLASYDHMKMDTQLIRIDDDEYYRVFVYRYDSQKLVIDKIKELEKTPSMRWLQEWLFGLLLGYDILDITDFLENYPIPYPEIEYAWTKEHEKTAEKVSRKFSPISFASVASPRILHNLSDRMKKFGTHGFVCCGKEELFPRKPRNLFPYLLTRKNFRYIVLDDERVSIFLKNLHHLNDETFLLYAIAKILGYHDSYIFTNLLKERRKT